MKPEKILKQIVADFVDVLGTTLVGIYLHGSLAMNCYNFKSSDIDFLVVISNEINESQKKAIISRILKISENVSEKGLEMSYAARFWLTHVGQLTKTPNTTCTGGPASAPRLKAANDCVYSEV